VGGAAITQGDHPMPNRHASPTTTRLALLAAILAPLLLITHNAIAQNLIAPASDIYQNAGGIPFAASYAGPHSGRGNVLNVFGNWNAALPDNDLRGVVFDGGMDAFDGFGFLNVTGAPADRSIVRRVDRIFTGAGGDSAFRWVDTITNTSTGFQVLVIRFGGDLGSDAGTTQVAAGPGYRVTTDAGPFDAPVAVVWGGNGVLTPISASYPGIHAPADGFYLQYTISIGPGESVSLIHLAVLGTNSPAGITYCTNRAIALTTIGTGIIGAINGAAQIPGNPLLDLGCNTPGPILNWYTPHAGEIRNADVNTSVSFGFSLAPSYSGPSNGQAAAISGIGAANDYRGVILDGGGDAFDGFGLIHVTGALIDRSVQRDVRPNSTLCDSAWRFTDTITNTSGGIATFDIYFGGNLGSDAATVEQFNGAMYRITTQNAAPIFNDPPVAFLWGNNPEALAVNFFRPGGSADEQATRRSVTLAPGASATFVHFALIADRRANGWEQMRTRAQHLIGNGRADRLFAGIPANQSIANWSSIPSCPGDSNRDGTIDLLDLLDFTSAWSANLGQNCP